MRNAILVLISFFTIAVKAQEPDTVQYLQPVVIQAYDADRPLRDVPAAVSRVGEADLQRFGNTSLLPVVNAVPGVRMEERSPGSYRFSIRGSLLRSPFGVRNVKMYWNGLPLTDGGGNTYLNLIDFSAVGRLDIIKGPASSLYGAGTGGAVLLNSPVVTEPVTRLSVTGGSFGLRRLAVSHHLRTSGLTLRLHASAQHADGYREHTKMDRYALHGDLVFPAGERGVASATFFFTRLHYQTPGALTRDQYETNPQQARPASGINRGAVEQQAAVYNTTPYLGFSYERDWNETTTTKVGIFGAHAAFENSAIRNYEVRNETNAGIRTETRKRLGEENQHRLTFGAEFQYFLGPLIVYDNNYGDKGPVQTDDDLTAAIGSIFAQAQWALFDNTYLTLGASINTTRYTFTRKTPTPVIDQEKSFKPFFSPRVAVLKKLGENVNVFANISRGFSPPSLAEVRPSTNAFNETLQPERGTSYEMGTRGQTPDRKFSWELIGYDFGLRKTIVVQRLEDGADYFINAGRTSQRGVEAMISWHPFTNAEQTVSDLSIWNNYAYNRYRFIDYVNDDTDYSGNRLTGVPQNTNTTGLDVIFSGVLYMNATCSYVSEIPLNDANEAFADAYVLLGMRAGYRGKISRHNIDVFAGIDNALDEKYSRGNDLNAVGGGRFFNAAAPRNYYVGMNIKLHR